MALWTSRSLCAAWWLSASHSHTTERLWSTVSGTFGIPRRSFGDIAPAWSPDGATLAYECGQDICTINPEGAAVRRLTADGAGNRHPTWSPDGSKIAFAATHAGVTDLYVTASNGSGGTRRLTQSVGFVGSPAWSPDGTRLAFDCSVDAGNDDLCWMNADGTGFTMLTNDPARDYGAAWK